MSHRVDRKIDLFDKSVVALDFVYREELVREEEVRETVVTRQPHDPVGLDLECIGRNAGAAPGRTMEIIREKIGRAACRERVRTSVDISMLEESFKKKNK